MPAKRITRKPHKIIRMNGQRIAWTNTSPVPDAEVVAAIKFVAAEIDLDRVIVHIKGYGHGYHLGMAYYSIPYEANLDALDPMEWSHLITIRTHSFQKDGWVSTLGHEAKHIEQFKRGTLRREKRRRNCESQCNAFGAWIAERWAARAEA